MSLKTYANAKFFYLFYKFRDFANLFALDFAVKRLKSTIVKLIRLSNLSALQAYPPLKLTYPPSLSNSSKPF